MSWSDNIAALANAMVDPMAFGEHVLLPSGREVTGMLTQKPPPRPWNTTGTAQPPADSNPELYLLPIDATGLAKNDALQIGAQRYILAAPPDASPRHDGLIRLELFAAPADAPRPPTGSRWQ
jgi:hypothetical protein